MKLSPEQLNRPTVYGFRRSVVEDWGELIPNDTVVLISRATGERCKGTVDAISEDKTILWLVLENAGGRKLFHHCDGYQTLADPRPK